MLPSLIEFLEHIENEIDFLLKHSENLEYENFIEDEMMKKAFVRSLEVIGEASKKIPEEFRLKYTSIDWKGLAGLRDILIHHYWGIDYDLVWDVLNDDIPNGKIWLNKIIEIEKNNNNEQ